MLNGTKGLLLRGQFFFLKKRFWLIQFRHSGRLDPESNFCHPECLIEEYIFFIFSSPFGSEKEQNCFA
jgi:hypothetical protein